MNQFMKRLTHYHYYGIQLSSLSFQAKTVGAPHVVSSFLKLHYKTFTKDFVAIFLISSQCDWCHFCGSYVNIFDYCFLWNGLGYNPRNISQKIQVLSNQSQKSKILICRYLTLFTVYVPKSALIHTYFRSTCTGICSGAARLGAITGIIIGEYGLPSLVYKIN
jgi:hypothetical protein